MFQHADSKQMGDDSTIPCQPISGKLDQKALWSEEKEDQISLEAPAEYPQSTYERFDSMYGRP